MTLLDVARYSASDVALMEEATGRQWTYDQLRIEVMKRARLITGGIKQLVFVFCANRGESVFAYLAALEAKSAVCLLDAAASTEIKESLIRHYDPAFVFDQFSSEPVRRSSAKLWLHPDLTLLLSTSGTTGSPKLVRLSERNILSNAKSIAEYLEIVPGERAIATLPMQYSYGLSVLNSHLIAGASIVLTEQSVLRPDFWKVAAARRVTSMAGVPYIYALLARMNGERFFPESLKTLTQAGGRLTIDLIDRFWRSMEARKGRFFVMYGQTEATARISYVPPDRLADKMGSVGIAIPEGRLRIIEGKHEIAEPGINGEVVYEGPNVMMGYASERRELELGDEMGGRLRTGDLGHFDKDGFLFLTGRTKRFAKIFGLRVNLDEIEATVRGIGPVAVVSDDEKVVVWCEEVDENRRIAVQKELSELYKLNVNAFDVRSIKELPRMASGKIDYARLQEGM